jgi:ribosome-associated protein
MQHIEINHEPVELYKILKFEALASSGGEAKSLIAAGAVRVNGKVETRKRCKMNAGDFIEFGDEKYKLRLAQ